MTSWTNEMIGRLGELARGKNSASEIATALNLEFGRRLSRNSIIGKMMREGISPSTARKLNPEWSRSDVANLRTLAKSGHDDKSIAAELVRWSVKAIREKARVEGIKIRTVRVKAKPKIVAPPMVTEEVPFLPPAELAVEYVPTGGAPKPFLEAGQFECQYILPGQDTKPAPERLVCANQVNFASRFRFCAACGERLTMRATVVRIREPKHNGARPGRKRSVLSGALL